MRFLVGGVVVLIALVIGLGAYFHVPQLATIFTNGTAGIMCADVFVAGRDPDTAFEQDFHRRTSPGKYLALADFHVDREERSVSASLFGLARNTAIYREGIGCTPVLGMSEAELRAQGEGVASALPPADPNALWPEGEATLADNLPAGVDGAALTAALDAAFAEPDPEQPRVTRAVVVVHHGRILAERYAPGFDANTAHLSNSIAKTVTSALVGILVGQGRLDVNAPAPVPEWQAGDPRAAITLDNLLRMSSGLSFQEDYNGVWTDITRLYHEPDMGHYVATRPLEHPPGTVFHYSTGTSILLGRIVRDAAGPDLPTAFAFPRRYLFDPIGARTAVLEVDPSGGFIGGSRFWASARDYARMGQLYLQDGVWNGQRVLPEGWAAYTTRLTPISDPRWSYGAQIWLNSGADPNVRRWPEMPADAYAMVGHQDQYVVVIPSRQAVITRFGLTEFDNFDIGTLVGDVLAALPPEPGA